jgi:ubiquinone/menaquinone biosynthesis C-methylase UbiE
MGFYSRNILPYLLDWAMADPNFAKYRQAVLADVQGDVLEIGFGTGLNLAYYPERIQNLVAIDANPGVHRLAEKRIKSASLTVDHRILNGENLPMPDNSFDSVVSTWTLCSIANVQQALQEIHRVLKPGGKFFFIEHGLSNEPNVQTWQNRLTPIQKVIGDGCHLNRNIRQLLESQFDTVKLEEFYAEKTPKILGYLYKGTATKVT